MTDNQKCAIIKAEAQNTLTENKWIETDVIAMIKLFDEIPLLENAQIILRKLRKDDLPYLREMIADDAVYRYLPTFLFEKQYNDLSEMLSALYSTCFDDKESLILCIERKSDGKFCGLAEFYGFKDVLHKVCVGYRLKQDCWGGGIATATVGLMVDYLFSQTDIEIITASTMIENAASARVLEKNGFIRTARAVPEDWGYAEPTIADKWFR